MRWTSLLRPGRTRPLPAFEASRPAEWRKVQDRFTTCDGPSHRVAMLRNRRAPSSSAVALDHGVGHPTASG